MADLLFNWLELGCLVVLKLSTIFSCLVESKHVKQEVSSRVMLPVTM